MASGTKTTIVRHGLSGFGPRNSMLLRNSVIAFLSERARFNKIGLHLEFYVFDNNSVDDSGSGSAWQPDCDAAMNSGLPGEITPPIGLSAAHAKFAKANGDIGRAAGKELRDNRARYEGEFRKRNPAVYALLKEASRADGTVDTKRPFSNRGLIGMIQLSNMADLLEFVRDYVPEIRISFQYDTAVVDVDFTDPKQPRLLARKKGTEITQPHTFDFVHLGHGTTGRLSVHKDLEPFAFYYIHNRECIQEFFDMYDMLDDNDRLHSSSRIGITGMRLSAYDPIPIVLTFTDILEVTEDGWMINRRNATKYRGLFTFISRSDGEVAPPRHVHNKRWPGTRSILSTAEVHALRLNRNSDYTTLLAPILRANVALELDDHPVLLGADRLALEQSMNTHKRMANYHIQNEAHIRGELTELALLRAGQQALFGGFGFEAEPAEAQADLVARAPLTRTDRGDAALRRSLASDVTRAPEALHTSNAEFFRHYKRLQALNTASPVAVQDMVAQLFELGVASHLQADFSEIKLDTVPVCKHRKFDMLFAAKTVTPSADDILSQLCKWVREMIPGVPEYYKGRFLQTREGKLINCVDTGLGGEGASILVGSEPSIVGCQWTETSSYAAAADCAKTASRLLVLLSAVQVCGSKTAAEDLFGIYQQNFPSNAEFDQETAIFAKAYREVHEKNIFLRVADTFARDSPYDFTQYCVNENSREECIDFLESIRPGARQVYQNELSRIPDFRPISKTDFYMRRHLDFTVSEMDHLWGAAMAAIDDR